jgi:hypothetical protein
LSGLQASILPDHLLLNTPLQPHPALNYDCLLDHDILNRHILVSVLAGSFDFLDRIDHVLTLDHLAKYTVTETL